MTCLFYFHAVCLFCGNSAKIVYFSVRKRHALKCKTLVVSHRQHFAHAYVYIAIARAQTCACSLDRYLRTFTIATFCYKSYLQSSRERRMTKRNGKMLAGARRTWQNEEESYLNNFLIYSEIYLIILELWTTPF